MSNKEHLGCLFDVTAHIKSALAVAREALDCSDSASTFRHPECLDHLLYLEQATVILLERAATLAKNLEEAMERAA